MNLSSLELINQVTTSAKEVGFEIETFGQIGAWPLLSMTRCSQDGNGQNIYISAGIHGDEPAGPLALLELLKEDALPKNHNYWICPVLNPSGLDDGTRENADGLDLNRDYRDFHSEEIRSHAAWVKRQITSLDIALHLHEDWESKGFYLYELNFGPKEGLADNILEAVAQHLPIETASEIDGHHANAPGLIRPESIPEIEEGHPEAIYFKQEFGGLNYTLETPSALALAQRIAAMKAAVIATL